MKLPTELVNAVIKATAKELADRLAPDLAALQLVTIKQAAELLGVSEPKARALIREYVELGEASKRVSLETLRKLIEARTICVCVK